MVSAGAMLWKHAGAVAGLAGPMDGCLAGGGIEWLTLVKGVVISWKTVTTGR